MNDFVFYIFVEHSTSGPECNRKREAFSPVAATLATGRAP